MGRLSEQEIFDRLRESLRIAAECSEALAIDDVKGREYVVLREHLKLIEGCCIQAATWREDARWLGLGRLAAECHKRAGDWLRPQLHVSRMAKVKLAPKHRNEMFVMLAANLREFMKGVDTLKDAKTGHIGMVLPKPPEMGRQVGAPVQVLLPERIRKQGGLLLPKTMH